MFPFSFQSHSGDSYAIKRWVQHKELTYGCLFSLIKFIYFYLLSRLMSEYGKDLDPYVYYHYGCMWISDSYIRERENGIRNTIVISSSYYYLYTLQPENRWTSFHVVSVNIRDAVRKRTIHSLVSFRIDRFFIFLNEQRIFSVVNNEFNCGSNSNLIFSFSVSLRVRQSVIDMIG